MWSGYVVYATVFFGAGSGRLLMESSPREHEIGVWRVLLFRTRRLVVSQRYRGPVVVRLHPCHFVQEITAGLQQASEMS